MAVVRSERQKVQYFGSIRNEKKVKISLRILMVVSMFSALSGCYGDCGLTDEQVLEKAVEFYLLERQPGTDGYYESGGIKYKRYASYKEFIAVNPNCCRIEGLLPEWGVGSGASPTPSMVWLPWHSLHQLSASAAGEWIDRS